MACGFDKELLSALLDGELAERDQVRVQSHVDSCAECRKEYSDVQSASSTLHQLGRAPVPAAILKGVEREINRTARPDGFFARYRRALEGALALAAALLVVLSVVTLTEKSSPKETAAAPAISKIMDPKRSEAPDAVAKKKEFGEAEKAQYKREEQKENLDRGQAQVDKAPRPVERALKEADEKKSAPSAEGTPDGYTAKDDLKDNRRDKDAQQAKQPPAPPQAAKEESPMERKAKDEELAKGWGKEGKAPTPSDDSKQDRAQDGKPGSDGAGKAAGQKPSEPPPAPAKADREKEFKQQEDLAKNPENNKPPSPAPLPNSAPGNAPAQPAPIPELTYVVYSSRLADARDIVRSELSKLVGESQYQDGMFTATLNAQTAPKFVKALSARKEIKTLELSSEARSAIPNLAELSRRSWDDTLAMAKAATKDKGGKNGAEEFRAEGERSGGGAGGRADKPQPSDPHAQDLAKGGELDQKTPKEESKKMAEASSKGQPAPRPQGAAPAPAAPPAAGAIAPSPVLVKIYLLPSSQIQAITERIRRAAEEGNAPAEKK